MNSLQEQIDTMSKSIKTDSYPMSIGELAALYKEGDLDISPVYHVCLDGILNSNQH